jgi:hypothetical protein
VIAGPRASSLTRADPQLIDTYWESLFSASVRQTTCLAISGSSLHVPFDLIVKSAGLSLCDCTNRNPLGSELTV